MSADLLRRAATRLRESALAAAEVAPGPWLYATEDPRPDRLLLAQDGKHAIATVYEESEVPKISALMALVHPPVALALADLIEEGLPYATMAIADQYPVYVKAVAVARAVLREPEGGDQP